MKPTPDPATTISFGKKGLAGQLPGTNPGAEGAEGRELESK